MALLLYEATQRACRINIEKAGRATPPRPCRLLPARKRFLLLPPLPHFPLLSSLSVQIVSLHKKPALQQVHISELCKKLSAHSPALSPFFTNIISAVSHSLDAFRHLSVGRRGHDARLHSRAFSSPTRCRRRRGKHCNRFTSAHIQSLSLVWCRCSSQLVSDAGTSTILPSACAAMLRNVVLQRDGHVRRRCSGSDTADSFLLLACREGNGSFLEWAGRVVRRKLRVTLSKYGRPSDPVKRR